MHIHLNGAAYALEHSIHIADLITRLDLTEKRVAVELNLNIVPRSQYAETWLNAGDRVEIVQAIGGGSPSSAPSSLI